MPFYSPYKVAEQFNLMATLFPDRIDIGVGRSAGSEGQAPAALGVRNTDAFRAVDELLSWLGKGHFCPAVPGYICFATLFGGSTLGFRYEPAVRYICRQTWITLCFWWVSRPTWADASASGLPPVLPARLE